MNLAIKKNRIIGHYTSCHNPYFIGMNLAIGAINFNKDLPTKSQSLFYWNEPCNYSYVSDSFVLIGSQSLFYWNEPCNGIEGLETLISRKVTILILLE